jgi:UDP-N-acetylglucosamine 1-carboxyvinyltransferase
VNPSIPEDCYLVEGGTPLTGRIRPSGSKNAALPILAATLLTEETVHLTNLPSIRDVESMLTLLETTGSIVERHGSNAADITARDIHPDRLDAELCRAIRASILLTGPLLARTGRVSIPPPGGDVIGRRRLDTHFLALEKMGAEVAMKDGLLEFRSGGLRGCSLLLDEPSVTATENAIMAAAVAEGETVIYNAACEPNVQDLINLLRSMGALIEGGGTNRVVIHGKGALLDGSSHRVVPDHIEIGSFIGLAAVCGGKVIIEGVPGDIIEPIMNGLSRLGVSIGKSGDDLLVDGSLDLVVQPDRSGAIPTVYDAPWPGFSPDLTSTAVVVATQAAGTSLIFEKMFESRLFFVDKLVAMGARIIQCDPHRVVISGPAALRGTDVSSPDIRAGMALLTAALCSQGRSLIRNVHQIERGYENLLERLGALGAVIEAGPSR